MWVVSFDLLFVNYYSTTNVKIIKKKEKKKKKSRYQIYCTRRVSGTTLIRYTEKRKIGKPNNLKFWEQ
jgi:hypothetical protein